MSYPSTTQTLAGVIAECPSAADLMSQLGVDCGRHARDSLQRVCEDEGLDPHLTLEVILASDVRQSSEAREDWAAAPIEDLADHIIAVHHAYLRKEMPRLQLLIDKAIHDEPAHAALLQHVQHAFADIRAELARTMIAQEQICFPAIRQLGHALRRRAAGTSTATVDRPIGSMCQDCSAALFRFEQLRERCANFNAPPDAGAAYRGLMQQLLAFEDDLRTHAHLEQDVLMPRAATLEAELVASHRWQPRDGGSDLGQAAPPPAAS